MSRRMALRNGGLHALLDRAGSRVPPRPHRLTSDERFCRNMTRREAANFYWGFVALPRAQRTAIYALYSFARQVDDDVDVNGTGSDHVHTPSELSRFERHRERVKGCYDGAANDPVMRVLGHVVRAYEIPRDDLGALIDGVEMDLRLSTYGTWEDLTTYCRCVASAVGRMCVRIFGFTDPSALECADDLGLAMQLTNILRDVREDAAMGRVYLPQSELAEYGVQTRVLSTGEVGPEWEPFVRFEIERAHSLFSSGITVTRFIPRRAAACVYTMAGIYQAILLEIERDPYLPLYRRASLNGKDKVSVMLRSWLQAV